MEIIIEPTLKKIGLTGGEIKVYLALIRLGSTTVGPVIDKAQISSSKVYIILEKLIQKGLVTYITKEKTRYFQASMPIALMDYVELKEKEIKETKKTLKDIIDEIQKIRVSKKEEEARIYRGYSGLKSGLFEAIKTIPNGGEYYFFSTGYGQIPYFKRFFNKLAAELRRRRIKIKGIANISEKEIHEKYYKKIGYNMKYVKIKWPADIGIIGDFLTILVYDGEEPVLYLIRSKILVDSYLKFFNNIWRYGI